MAPEQTEAGRDVDSRADIYALGVVLYEMLTGERPNQEVIAPSRKVQIDVRLDEIVLRALEKDPELRYQQASLFKTQLDTISSNNTEPKPESRVSTLLKSERGRIGIQEYPGAAIPYPAMGEVALHSDRLAISQGYRQRVIPLENIRGLGELVMNWWFSPAGHRSAGVEFEEDGQHRKLAFLPGTALFRTVADSREHSAEWMLAIQGAVEAATARKIPVRSQPELMRVKGIWQWAWVALPVLFAVFLLAQSGWHHLPVLYLPPLFMLLAFGWRSIQPRNAVDKREAGPPAPPPPWAFGYEYQSPRTFCGLPLVHVAHGFDPATGKPRHARGIVAVGQIATGWLAIGGRAYGGIALGGIAAGGIALGGVAVGIVSIGGLVVALLAAFGGMAVAPVAIGGFALGWLAIGGTAMGAQVIDGRANDAEALRRFHRTYQPHLMAIMGGVWVSLLALAFGVSMWAKRRVHQGSPPASRAKPWKRSLILTLIAVIATVLLVRTFLLTPYVAATSAAAPEIPQGSLVLAWKPGRHFAAGDLVAYDYEGRINLGRIVANETGEIRVNRNGKNDFTVARAKVLGKVVTVLWRGSPAAPVASAPAIDQEKLELGLKAAESSLERIKTLSAAGMVPQTDLEKAESEVLILRAKLAGDARRVARLELKNAERNFDRIKEAFDRGVLPRTEFDRAKDAVDQARKTLDQELLAAFRASWPAPTQAVIYDATVNGRKIKVMMSTAPFEARLHEVGPRVPGDDGDSRLRKTIDGYPAVGSPDGEEGTPHLTRLAVSFDGNVVEAPKKLISHVFRPHDDITSDGSGLISISSDAKCVTVHFGVGDGADSAHRAFTFTDDGKCHLGAPPRPGS